MLQKKKGEPAVKSVTIGMDLGDKNHVVCVLSDEGGVTTETTGSHEFFFSKYKKVFRLVE